MRIVNVTSDNAHRFISMEFPEPVLMVAQEWSNDVLRLYRIVSSTFEWKDGKYVPCERSHQFAIAERTFMAMTHDQKIDLMAFPIFRNGLYYMFKLDVENV